jgi:xanthine/CO dehydrogenase XdhC/CoxF family maturation factor
MQTAKDVHALLAAADTDAGLFMPRAALATLVRTTGSSFRRAGSRMLFGGNGCVVRGFGGGCPESDLALRARRVIDSGHGERAIYDRDHSLDLLIEAGCGGELEIVLEPIAQRSSLRFLDVVAKLLQSRSTAIMATVFPRDPYTASVAVARVIWRSEEILHDDIRNAEYIATILAAIDPLRIGGAAILRNIAIKGMDADVLYERIVPPIQLVLIGANPVADAAASAALELAWPAIRIDPKATTLGEFARLCSTIVDGNTFIVSMTNLFERDVEFAAAALATPAPYVGILGSHQRAALMRRRLEEICSNVAERLYSPAGLSIGSEDAEQIAISLIAEIMAVAKKKSGTSLSRSSESIHSSANVDMEQTR